MTPGRWTLRRRVTVLVIALVALVAATMGTVSTYALQGSLVDQLDERLVATSDRGMNAARPPRGEDRDEPPPALSVPGQGAGTLTLTVDGAQTVAGYLDDDGTFELLTAEQQDALTEVAADGKVQTVAVPGLGDFRVLARTGPDDVLLVTGLSLADVQHTVRDYLLAEGAVALAGMALAALGAGILVRREMRPLERVARTATRVAELPLHSGAVSLAERVPEADTDPATEVGQVGAALNRMLGHVEDALAARHESETQVRQFVADASHELRTPLASIRGYAELVRRRPEGVPDEAQHAMARVESESRRMTTLVEDMLLLARLDAGRPLARAEVDLVVLAVEAVADAHAASPAHHWRLDVPDDGATVVGDEDRLRQVLVNLLANARVHTPAGTTVDLAVRRGAGSVVVEVRDDGPGVPDDLRPRLFQRFTRGDEGRTRRPAGAEPSTGLGLAIVDSVVRAHGGTIVLAESKSGSGAAFVVTLPGAVSGSG